MIQIKSGYILSVSVTILHGWTHFIKSHVNFLNCIKVNNIKKDKSKSSNFYISDPIFEIPYKKK